MKQFKLYSAKRQTIMSVAPKDVVAFYTEHWVKAIESVRKLIRDTHRLVEVMGDGKVFGGELRDTVEFTGTLLLCRFAGPRMTWAQIATNLVVDKGREAAIDRLQAAAVAVHDYMAIGTGSSGPTAGDTALGTEVGTRVQGSLTQPTAYTDRLVSTFAAGNGTATITEAGRLNASSTGNLFCRSVFTGIAKGSGDSLTVTYDVTD